MGNVKPRMTERNLPQRMTTLSRKEMIPMKQAVINVEGTSTIETAAAAKKLIEVFGSQNIRAISVKHMNENNN